MTAALEPEVLLRHAAHVRALARRLVFDAELALEVEQETWLAALRHAPAELRDPRAWLARVVRHVARRLGARAARRGELEARAGGERARLESTGSTEADPSDLAAREQALRTLLAAVARLPEPVRRALVLHHLDGLSLAEVARRTEAPLETVRSRVKRGLELLRADLARGRGAAQWSLFLVRAFELAPPALGRGLGLVLRQAALALTLMSSTAKLVAGVTTLLLLAGLLQLARDPRRAPAPPVASSDELAPSLESAAGPRASAEPAERVRRDPVLARTAPPAPAASAARTGSLALELVWADDGRAAGQVLVCVSRIGAHGTWHATSDDGRLALADLEPGPLTVQPLPGGLAWLAIVAGETCAQRVEIPRGIAVTGRVETRTGEPIAGAEVFLSPGGPVPQHEGGVVARTDARGAFALRTAPAEVGACLSARAAGFAPSEQVLLTGARASACELTLVLAEPGRALRGRVLDAAGAPVAGALVLVGSEREWRPRRRPDGTPAWAPIGELARTDEAGDFALAGVALGELALQVRAPGQPAWRGVVAADAPQPLTIRLARAARVSGVVRTASGAPAAGVRVRVGVAGGFASLASTSDEAGAYALAPLPPGTLELVAERPPRGPASGGDARASVVLDLREGEERRWDPLLPATRELCGRIEADGLPLDGWTVRGWRDVDPRQPEPYVEETRTGEDGRFALERAPEGEIGLALFGRGGTPFALARLERVPVGGPEVVLRPDPALLPTCTILGRLVDASGAPVRSADVRAAHASLGATLVHPDPVDGSFRLPALPAGEWTLEVDPLLPGWGLTRSAHGLAPSETWDLGDVRLGLGGTLTVRLTRAPELAGVPVTAELHDASGSTVAWLTFEGELARSRPLAAGTYRLVLAGQGTALAPAQEVVIVAGEVTQATIELTAAAR
jgi:RNA polymerase sigma factor (sigma-70 family)